VLTTQHKQVVFAAETRAQRRHLAAYFTLARWGPSIKPQVDFPIELVLQVVLRGFLACAVARTTAGAVACPAWGSLSFDRHHVPLAPVGTVLTQSRNKHRCTLRTLGDVEPLIGGCC
jgi:hypothetical protein